MSTLQDDAAAMLETIDAVEGERKYARLTPSDRTLIFQLHAKGSVSQAEIAKAVGCDPATVWRTLRLVDTRAAARMILESGSAKMAQTVVDTKDAAIALKALGKIDVVREDATQGGNNLVVLMGTADHPLNPPDIRVLDVSPRNGGDLPAA